jgi:cytochrome c oxidase subunit II
VSRLTARTHFLIVAAIWVVLSVIGVAIVAGMQILPTIASREAAEENRAFVVMAEASVPVMLLVVVPAVYAIFLFRARADDLTNEGPPIHGHRGFERTWVAASFIAVIALAAYGSVGLLEIRGSTDAAVDVKAMASQWKWEYEYPGGIKSKELVLPVSQRARITIVSSDVIHDFSVPAFGVKKDAVPGRETYIFVTPTFTGHYGAQCAELCGFGHTRMLTDVRVLEPAEFDAWLAQQHAAAAG